MIRLPRNGVIGLARGRCGSLRLRRGFAGPRPLPRLALATAQVDLEGVREPRRAGLLAGLFAAPPAAKSTFHGRSPYHNP